MTYKITVNSSKTPQVFNALVKLIDTLKVKYNIHRKEEIIEYLKRDYNITLMDPTRRSDKNYYPVIFDSKKEYVIFLLRWA